MSFRIETAQRDFALGIDRDHIDPAVTGPGIGNDGTIDHQPVEELGERDVCIIFY